MSHSERSACPEDRQRREGGILVVPVEGSGTAAAWSVVSPELPVVGHQS
jgi:hypothetical protein